MYEKLRLENQNGQALLIIVLVMVIALTVGLSLAARTIINLRNTSEQAGSQKALSAAEAGIEQAIKENTAPGSFSNSFPGAGGESARYTTTVAPVSGSGSFLLNGPAGVAIQRSDGVYVWVRPYADNFTTSWSGDLTIYWGENSGNCNNAALEVAILYGTKDNPLLRRIAYDACPARLSSNRFLAASYIQNTISGKTLYNRAIIAGLANVLLIKINPIYKDAIIGVSGSSPLADQGKVITSVGTAGQSITRKITVFEGYPEIPFELFPTSLLIPD